MWKASPINRSEIEVEITDLLRSSMGIEVPPFLIYILVPRSVSTILETILKNKFSNVSKRQNYKFVGSLSKSHDLRPVRLPQAYLIGCL
jgi:hypothetical protein